MQTGLIVDFYDDPSGTVLKTKLAFAQIPDYIRQADYQSEEKLAALPDDAFALVMVDQGHKIRKFACVDKGNTALSALYFLENKDKLPEEAQKVAAANLVDYCQAFQIEPPWQLQKTAFWNSPKESISKGDAFAKELERMEAAGKDMNNLSWKELSDIKGKAKANLGAGKKKSADLTGSAIMPLQSNPNKEADEDSQLKVTDEKRASVEKNATKAEAFAKALKNWATGGTAQGLDLRFRAEAARLGKTEPRVMKAMGRPVSHADEQGRIVRRGTEHTFPKEHGVPFDPLARKAGKTKEGSNLYVDITGKSPPPQFEKRANSRYCLEKQGQGRFPIDSYGEVLDANKWFEENGKSLHPQERREYCTKLAARAAELHISVTDNIRKYAGKNFAPADDVRASVCTRMQFWADDAPERDTLSGMLDKYASASPDQFCQELTAFDVKTGLDQYWDDFIVDPVACVFGMEKTAEWLWDQGADRLTEDQLHIGVNDSQKIHAIEAKFGTELAGELIEKPSEVFDSLPLDSKRIIARILNDTQP